MKDLLKKGLSIQELLEIEIMKWFLDWMMMNKLWQVASLQLAESYLMAWKLRLENQKTLTGNVTKSRKEIIGIKSVSKIYNLGNTVVKALDNVSLSIFENDFISIMGPSGSGKSTLMNIIGCLDVPTKGSYKFNDEKISQMKDSQLADIRNQKIGLYFKHLIYFQNWMHYKMLKFL